jgi:hypothetical protein
MPSSSREEPTVRKTLTVATRSAFAIKGRTVRTALTVATRLEIGGAAARPFEQHRKQLGRQQPDILSEKAKE